MAVGLREFIKQTLSDVLSGVADAQADPSLGKNVAPVLNHQKVTTLPVHRSGGPSISINFDVAVTVESNDALEGGAGFKIAVLGMSAFAGGKKGKGSKNIVVNRIQFEVPVVLPHQKRRCSLNSVFQAGELGIAAVSSQLLWIGGMLLCEAEKPVRPTPFDTRSHARERRS